ncbi:MAG: hypothetical protein JXQ68_00155 [Campylobacterales bacterium]|nr:hypothetical protein [Campylobacterales bacterium]
MKTFEDLDYKIRSDIKKPLIEGNFALFEEKLKVQKLKKDALTEILESLIYDETHGFTFYLTPSISPAIFEYSKRYLPHLVQDATLAFEALHLTNNDVIKWFLDEGFNINTQDEESNTLTHIAASLRYTSAHSFNAADYDVPKPWELPNNDDPEKMKLLLSYRPNITIKNNAGLTPLDIAKNYDNYRVLKLLEDLK